MGIQYSSTNRTVGDVVEISVLPSTVSALLLAADPLRHDGTIYNKTSKTIYVQWGTTAATVAGSLTIPAGSNVDFPLDFTGPVQFLGLSAATGSVVVQTISYI